MPVNRLTSAIVDGVLKAHRLDGGISKRIAFVDIIAIDSQFTLVLCGTARFPEKTELGISSIGWRGRNCRYAHGKCNSRDEDGSELHVDDCNRHLCSISRLG